MEMCNRQQSLQSTLEEKREGRETRQQGEKKRKKET